MVNTTPMDNNIQMDDNMVYDEISGGENFDEPDEIDDPKKNIQRLSGKLSQALRTYNLEQETPDTDLNKYVIGMIATQAAKNMTNTEKQEIIKKINKGETIEDGGDEVDVEPMEECKQNNVMNDEKNNKRFEKKSFDFGKNPFTSKR